jgi:hypothetical protein
VILPLYFTSSSASNGAGPNLLFIFKREAQNHKVKYFFWGGGGWGGGGEGGVKITISLPSRDGNTIAQNKKNSERSTHLFSNTIPDLSTLIIQCIRQEQMNQTMMST